MGSGPQGLQLGPIPQKKVEKKIEWLFVCCLFEVFQGFNCFIFLIISRVEFNLDFFFIWNGPQLGPLGP